MYYLLNYIPCITQVLITIFRDVFNIDLLTVYAIMYLFLTPIYLLLINFIYLRNGYLTFTKSIVFMLSVIFMKVAIAIVAHKIETGYFIGDVPEQIYYLMIGVPSVIVIIGTCVIYLIKRR